MNRSVSVGVLVLSLSSFYSVVCFSDVPLVQNRMAASPIKEADKRGTHKDELREETRRAALLRKRLRDHSDPSGRPRPDLYEKAIEHLQRMQVVTEIGTGAVAGESR